MKTQQLLKWALRIVPAVILLQTLYFKFTAQPESVALFTKLNAEPFGRIGVGIMELIAGFLLLVPKTTRYGALLSVGLMLGAVGSHLFIIGINVMQDGGLLFTLAIVVLVAALALVVQEKDQLKHDLQMVLAKRENA